MGQIVQTVYADAIFELAKELGKERKFYDELLALKDLMLREPKLKVVLDTPSLSTIEKKHLIDKVFKSKISQELVNFIKLLIDKRRIRYFYDICDEYGEIYRTASDIKVAYVSCIEELSPEQVILLKDGLEKLTGAGVEIEQTIDADLIGGIKVVIGDRVIDQSALNKLRLLGTSLRELSL